MDREREREGSIRAGPRLQQEPLLFFLDLRIDDWVLPALKSQRPHPMSQKVFERVLKAVPVLGGHYSRDWSESVNVIGVISEPFAREFRERMVNISVIV